MRVDLADVRASGELATLLHLERPRLAGWIIYAGIALMVVSCGYLAIGTTERVSRGIGVMRPDGELIRVDSAYAGRVAAVRVAEGEKVAAGAVLVQLASPEVELDVSVKRNRLRLAGERAQAMIEQQEAMIQSDGSVAAAECGSLRRELEGLHDLERAGAVAPQEVRKVQSELSACVGRASPIGVRKKQIAAARRRVAALLAGPAQAADEAYDPQVASALAEIEVVAAELHAAEARRDDLTVKAATDGVVTKLLVHHPGEIVATGTPLLELAPESSTIVFDAFVPNSQVGAVRVGQKALIHLDAYPHLEFGSVTAEVVQVFPDAEERGNQFGFRVILAPRGTTGAGRLQVRLGLSGVTEIVTGRQTLWSYVMLGRQAAEEAR
jgi:multidrug resistance efflux pump